jgi:hypothetical protein
MNLLHPTYLKSTTLLVLSFIICAPTQAQLKETPILSNTLEISLPSFFKKMDSKLLETKYPPNNKPSEVYTNDEATINVAFKKTEQPLDEQNVFSDGKKLEQQLTSNAKIELVSSEEIKINGNSIHVFSFYSKAIDTKIYNIMFVFSLKGKMVIGSFNCIDTLQAQWQKVAFNIIYSIKKI